MSSSPANLFTLVRQGKWEAALNRISLFPDEASKPTTINFACGTSCRALPIHGALLASSSGKHVPQHVLHALLSANPDGLRTLDSLGRLPLAYAARYSASLRVLSYLLENYPQGACVTSDDGALPLMLACLHGDSIENVILLLEAYPEAASNDRRDNAGKSTFEYACDNPRPIKSEIMRLIFEKRSQLSVTGNGIPSESQSRGTADRNQRPMEITAEHEEMNDEVEAEAEITAEHEDMNGEAIKPGTKLCCICMERAVARVLVPCGHTILCSGCGSQQGLRRIDHKCPECRSHVAQAIKIFARVVDD